MQSFDVIVIGQGYAGLTAARLAAERGLNTANFEAALFGGLIINLNELDPVPEGAEHSGAELASNLAMSNMDKGVVTVSEGATALERDQDGLWLVTTDSEAYAARHIIVASGARLRKLGVPGEQEFFGQGVSECADCDGPMFSEMETVVVGGGDSAFQEALALSQFASKVTMVMRGAAPRARADLIERAAADPKLVRLANTQVVAIEGAAGKGVESVRIKTEGQEEKVLPTGGVFVFIGLEPNTAFLPADLPRDAAGALITSEQCATALPGLWAIGAVRSGYGGMLSDAAADAERVIAALS
jgi:thioredoxin reductase (NADPH)